MKLDQTQILRNGGTTAAGLLVVVSTKDSRVESGMPDLQPSPFAP